MKNIISYCNELNIGIDDECLWFFLTVTRHNVTKVCFIIY